jgi:tetratricopeptide (TPR) repeat protein
MERKKNYLISVLIFIGFTITASEYKSGIYNAYINSNMAEWKSIIDNMNDQKVKSKEFILELLNYQYGYTAWCIGNSKFKEAENYIELGQKNIDLLRKTNYSLSMINAYEAAFYGYRISMNKIKAPFYGPKSLEHANTAIHLDANNPFGYIQLGNAEFYMPAVFGGSKAEALKYYTKALKLMEGNPSVLKKDWNYLSLLTQIALTCEKLEQYDNASKYYQKILTIEPEFNWVKYELQPNLLKKMNYE